MRRVLQSLAIAAAALIATIAASRADCAQEIAAMRTQLAAVSDPDKHRELELLLVKAQNDNDAGRAHLCVDDLHHAQALVK
ncbi:MAG: hypothetical protein KGL11_11870 [Alphaproteobacteria bacterium]|nr:hypothetical protein [Alphaproteobacteria bacterium]